MMTPANALLGASRRLARTVPFRPFRLQLDRPVVSFSFDDFPLSAAEHAAPLLEAAGARGTFYFADRLAGAT
ncbi:MAG TPA: xylanase, partial [Devosia sp.]|nr:xylanase [Devosia sp.]